MANPYGIEQVDVPGILSAFTTARAQRTSQLLTERAMAREDAQLERENRLRMAYSKLKIPGADGSSGMSTAVSAYGAKDAAPAAPALPSDFGQIPGATGPAAVSAPPVAPAAAPAATGAPAAPGATPDTAPHPLQGWLDTNSGAIQDIMQQDPQSGLQIMQHFHQLDAEKQQEIRAHLEFADTVNEHGLRLLSGVHDQASWDAARQNYNTFLQQYKMPPQNLPEQYDPATVHGLQMHALSVQQQLAEMKPVVLGKDSQLINPVTKEVIADNSTQDLKQFSVHNADGTDTPYSFDPKTGITRQLREGGGAVGGAATTGGTSGGGSSRAVRNSNPGNLVASPWTQKQPGYTGKDSAGYAIFDTPDHGAAAQANLLAGYMAKGRNTVSGIIEKWAPRSSKGGDNTDAQVNNYIAYVAKQLGVTATQPLTPAQAPQIAAAMARFESGATGKAGSTRVPPAAGTAPPAVGGPGTPITGKPGNPLSDDATRLAAAIYKTKGTLPPMIGRTKGDVDKIMNMAAHMTMDEAHTVADQTVGTWQTTHAAGQTLTAFSKGPEARQTRALSVAIEHMELYRQAAKALQNGNVPMFNSLSQIIARATGQAAPTNAQALHDFVMDEVTKGVVGAGMALQDRERASQIIKQNSSPAQFAGGFDAVGGLLLGQLHGLSQQYHAGTGRDDFDRFLTPMGARVFKEYQTHHGLSAASGVAHVTSDADFAQLPHGTRFIGPDGRERVKP